MNKSDTVNEERFTGTVKITIEVKEKTNVVYIHAHETLMIMNIELTNKNGLLINPKHDRFPNQLVKLDFKYWLDVGNYELKLDFENDYGPSTNLVGFYKTKYEEDNQIK